MQCSNCHFENMPGVAACGRCGASLQLAARAINVQPPRAGSLAKLRRQWFPVRKWRCAVRDAATAALASLGLPQWPADLPRLGVLLRLVVPRWPQRYAGRRGRGRWMFLGYVACLLSGLLLLGSPLSLSLLGMVIALHAASVLDVVATADFDFRTRLIYGGVAFVLLTAVLYYPVWWGISQVASPQQFALAAPPFQEGDVVLVNRAHYRWHEPQVGDVVLYELAGRRIATRRIQHQQVYVQVQGEHVDRVIATAGQTVTYRKGELLLDGQPSAWLPLNRAAFPDGFSARVPENCYLIFPSTDLFAYPLDVSQAISIVPREQILGRAFFRSYPPLRWGFLR